MDKIRELLVASGLNEDVAGKIVNQLVEYKEKIRQQFETDYSAKINTAKKACLEEAEAYKQELAKRLQIFCEAKGPAIEAAIAKQVAIGESDAKRQLQGIKNLLEGIVPSANGKDQSDKIRALQKQLKTVSESRDKAVAVANRNVALAQKALKNQRVLETKLAAAATVSESRNQVSGPSRSAKPTTNRSTLVENQTRRVTQPKRSGSAIDAIAEAID